MPQVTSRRVSPPRGVELELPDRERQPKFSPIVPLANFIFIFPPFSVIDFTDCSIQDPSQISKHAKVDTPRTLDLSDGTCQESQTTASAPPSTKLHWHLIFIRQNLSEAGGLMRQAFLVCEDCTCHSLIRASRLASPPPVEVLTAIRLAPRTHSLTPTLFFLSDRVSRSDKTC
ncbi:hypothetical protein BDZ45DRAFT_17413 [Acephala macrosclerotiorum]|nr:hypothetical protein BDZ45DRAFT_17413 [Acephala macrosclerotiorum]